MISTSFQQHTTYIICVELAQGLNRQHLRGGLPTVLQRRNLQAALLKSLHPVIEVVHGLSLVLHTHINTHFMYI